MEWIEQRPAGREDLKAILDGCCQSIDLEVEAVLNELRRWGGDTPVGVRAATLEGADGEITHYRFEISRQITPPEYTGVEVMLGTQRVRGHVEGVEENGQVLLIALEKALRGMPETATISFDATYVLQAMKARLETVDPDVEPATSPLRRLLGLNPIRIGDSPPKHPGVHRRGLVEEQTHAIGKASGSDLALVFGPPGTGKTRTLGTLVAELAETRSLKVLVTAHTNTALDTAMASALECLPPEWVTEGLIVRSGRISRGFEHLGIGYEQVAERATQRMEKEINTRLTDLETRAKEILPAERATFLTLRRALRKKNNARKAGSIMDRIATLTAQIAELPSSAQNQAQVAQLWDDLASLRRDLARAAADVEHNARVVGATLSKLAVEPEAFGSFDAVIIDEASMASLPHIVIAGLHATEKITVFGDPCQLSPIVQSRDRRAMDWLGRNLYVHLGLEDPGTTDPRVAFLATQFRMAPAIRELVSEIFYAGRLRDAPSVERHREVAGGNLVLVDTSELGVTGEKRGSSRINEGHAILVAQLTRELAEAGHADVGIITPFAAQMKEIREAMRDIHPQFFYRGGSIRTIHRAQGGEQDVIILDTVDAPPTMSSFLDSSWNSDLANLLCVGLSRARKKLIIVAHTRGFRSKYGRRGALIMRILEEAYRRGNYIAPKPVTRLSEDPEAGAGGILGENP